MEGNEGYNWVSVTDANTGKQKRIGVHRLVAEAFVDIPVDKKHLKLEPNHKNGIKVDNDPNNLEWVTRSENIKHAYSTGLKKPSHNTLPEKLLKSKKVKATNTITGEVIQANSAKELSEKIDVPVRTVQYNAFDRKKPGIVKGFLIEEEL